MDAGRDLDALVAEKVMGARLLKAPKVWSAEDWLTSDTPTETEALAIVNPNYKPGDLSPPFEAIPPYSTDIAAAWQLVDAGKVAGVWRWSGGGYVAMLNDLTPDEYYFGHIYKADADKSPHAICLAALRAVGAL